MAMPRSALFVALSITPLIASAQINLVSVTSCGPQVFPASTCTIPSSGRGNLLVVAWSSTWGSAPTIGGVTDNAANTYVEAGTARASLSTNDMVDIWYARNSNAGASSLSITPNPGSTNGGAVIWEFSGVDTVSPLDQSSVLSNQSASATPSGAAVTTTAGSELIISTLVPAGSFTGIASGSNFTNDLTFFGAGWAHLIASAPGTYAAQWNTSSAAYASSSVSFKGGTASTTGSSGFSACDLNQDSVVNVVDVQLAVNMSLGLRSCSANIAGNGVCNMSVVQTVENAALGGSCTTTTAPVSHTVTLNWVASLTPNVTYNVYRAGSSGGQYTKLAGTAMNTVTYTDTSVAAGQTYYYVTTAVDGSGNESTKSNEAPAVVPFP
jgi:hypothetical protein